MSIFAISTCMMCKLQKQMKNVKLSAKKKNGRWDCTWFVNYFHYRSILIVKHINVKIK